MTDGSSSRRERAVPGAWIGRELTIVLALLVVLASVLVPAAVRAADGGWQSFDQGRVRLIAAVTATGTAPVVPLALEFDLLPGWKIYWRAPGEAGYPPAVDWAGSANIAAASFAWPAPRRYDYAGLTYAGYEGRVVLPIEARLDRPGESLAARAAVDFLVCSAVCVPQLVDVALTVDRGPAAPSPEAALIADALARVPVRESVSGLAVSGVDLDLGSGTVVVSAESAAGFRRPDVFLEGPSAYRFGQPIVERGSDDRTVRFRVPVKVGNPAELAAAPLTVTLVDGDQGFEVTRTAANRPADSASAGGRWAGLLPMLLVAFVGGVILNLMPCVLPILSIKLLAVAGLGGRDPGEVRREFLATASGIVASFLLLAAVLAAALSAGAAIGWGFQFQQPWFLAAMTLVVVLFACNLLGLFEFHLPDGVARRLFTADPRHGLAGSFLTGALATLLATPCSAPFVGTAIGFALARGWPEIIATFGVMGVGLGLPYLAVAAFPGLATRLPKPGGWMVWLRRLLAMGLVATAGWLAWLIAGVAGAAPAIVVSGAAAIIALALWARHAHAARWGRPATAVSAVVAVAAIVASATLAQPEASAQRDRWHPFDQARIARDVAAGKVVYVNVTADWCITCRVNEAVVLSDPEVAERLFAPGVVAMRADWTRPDETIARFLAGFGRYGIPFDGVYGPAVPHGEALPELLTREAVLAAVGRAAAPN